MDEGERNFLTGKTSDVTSLNLENSHVKDKLEWRGECSYFIHGESRRLKCACA